MNREQKLIFIKTQHPDLYKLLEEHLGDCFFENVLGADTSELDLYNAWIGFYCGKHGDEKLMDMLVI